jgi:hypothetical protein
MRKKSGERKQRPDPEPQPGWPFGESNPGR